MLSILRRQSSKQHRNIETCLQHSSTMVSPLTPSKSWTSPSTVPKMHRHPTTAGLPSRWNLTWVSIGRQPFSVPLDQQLTTDSSSPPSSGIAQSPSLSRLLGSGRERTSSSSAPIFELTHRSRTMHHLINTELIRENSVRLPGFPSPAATAQN